MLCTHSVKSEWADYAAHTLCGSRSGQTILSRHSVEVGVGGLYCPDTVWKSERVDYTVQTQCGNP